MQKLSTTAAAAAVKILLKKRRNLVKFTFFTYNIKKKQNLFFGISNFNT
jgi:hypothetical protein